MRIWIENNFNAVIAIAFVVGMFAPGLDLVPVSAVIAMTGILIFFACSKIRPEDFLAFDAFHVGVFSIVRFLLFPIALYYVSLPVVPDLAPGVLLLSLMPAGVAVSALCAISGGNVALGLSLTLITSVLAPVLVPAAFTFVGEGVNINVWDLFMTLLLIVMIPVLVYFLGAIRVRPVRQWVEQNTRFFSVLLLALIMGLVVAQKRDVLLDDPMFVLSSIGILGVLFTLYYLFGFLVSFKADRPRQIAVTYASGAINNALAITLAYVYFPAKVALFMVLSEIVWIAAIAGYQAILDKKRA
jgi:BASS family bile acid:Na+ symporter